MLTPVHLWDLYIEYLWNYSPDSWVATTAYTARIIAILLAFPLTFLALLDIATYVIARTLGIINDTTTSTIVPPAVHRKEDRLHVVLDSGEDVPSIEVQNATPILDSIPSILRTHITSMDTSHSHPIFASEEKLSGVGEFSPTGSVTSSPTLSRKPLPFFTPLDKDDSNEEGITMTRRPRKTEKKPHLSED